MIKFYDTSTLLLLGEEVFADTESQIAISSISLDELEEIKTNKNKNVNIQYLARKLGDIIWDKKDEIITIFYDSTWDNIIKEKYLLLNNDARIITSAYYMQNELKEDVVFFTSDTNCGILAETIFGLKVQMIREDDSQNYCGYTELKCENDEALAEFYDSIIDIHNELNTNEYLLVKDKDNHIIDKYKRNSEGYLKGISYNKFNSKQFGEIKPKDEYQICAMDSLVNNQLTMLQGPAGCGKTLLALGYAFDQIEKGIKDKLIIFSNPVAAKNAAKLGFYPGDKSDKLLDSSIGGILISKLGSRFEVERLMDKEILTVLSFSDLRGFDSTGMNAILYITEAQNLDVPLMQLALQRLGSDCQMIIDGDDRTQVDMIEYSKNNNGMKKASEVFRGDACFGQVYMPNIYRSHIANKAQEMM